MPQRNLFLAAYDVTQPRRLIAALKIVRRYATGGQKSVHEVFLTPPERGELLHELALILDEAEDRFLLLRLDPRSKVHTLGNAMSPADPNLFYVG